MSLNKGWIKINNELYSNEKGQFMRYDSEQKEWLYTDEVRDIEIPILSFMQNPATQTIIREIYQTNPSANVDGGTW